MTDNEKKIKTAFMRLLDDMEDATFGTGKNAGGYCSEWCPIGLLNCPYSNGVELPDEVKPLSQEICGEEIFNFYLEIANHD